LDGWGFSANKEMGPRKVESKTRKSKLKRGDVAPNRVNVEFEGSRAKLHPQTRAEKEGKNRNENRLSQTGEKQASHGGGRVWET